MACTRGLFPKKTPEKYFHKLSYLIAALTLYFFHFCKGSSNFQILNLLQIFIWNVETGTLESKISNGSEDSLVTVSWSPDGRNLACGGTKGQFYQCDVKGNVLDSWEGVRVLCLRYAQQATVFPFLPELNASTAASYWTLKKLNPKRILQENLAQNHSITQVDNFD